MPDSAPCYLGMDIGGSHATAALIDAMTGQWLPDSVHRIAIDPQADYATLVSAWTGLLQLVLTARPWSLTQPVGVAVAMPGPFDYDTGVAKLAGLGKFDRLFGANLRLAFRTGLPSLPITFVNDASAFALGCSAGYPGESVVVLTLGTGLGAAFVRNGRLCTDSIEGVPAGGYLYDQPYGDSIIENYLSTRYLVQRFGQLTGRATSGRSINGRATSERKPTNVAELIADADQPMVTTVLAEFGEQLGRFITPHLLRFGADRLILGGGIARTYDRFGDSLTRSLPTNFPVHVEPQTETINMVGAVQHARQIQARLAVPFRKTEQYVMPARKETAPEGYDIYPTVSLPDEQIDVGIDRLVTFVQQHPTVLIDGYVGVLWKPLMDALADGLWQSGDAAEFRDVRAALKSGTDIDQLTSPYLGGDDPIFGHICPLDLTDFFELDRFDLQPDAPANRRVIYGPGAGLVDPDAPVVYVDLPKNELQFRARAGSITNLGQAAPGPAKAMYKRFYFVDWPVLNRHKKALLSRVALLIDGQRPDEPTTMSGEDFRAALDQTTRQAFRVRPWFEPGAWGGQWLNQHIAGLNPDAINYAWSFELIVPENGLVFQSGDALLECSFDWLMFQGNRAVLGEAADRFGDEFPIRFDFLDTIDGGDLSVQCHPRPDYIREHFGEAFTQDETYYILTAQPNAQVYLGFQADVDPTEFTHALRTSFEQKTPIDIQQYVQAHESKPHDLFLIPAGTIHSAGAGNMVLEISATPYIYTFKLYDWLRIDLDGQPRPLNIDRGLANLDFGRQGDVVAQSLLARPVVIHDDSAGRVVHLPTHPEHFYDVHRLEFDEAMTIRTDGQCHVLSLVAGQSVAVETDGGRSIFQYAETFVIPAAVPTYRLTNLGSAPVKVIKAFVKPILVPNP
ncbi:MAG: ROK family protein [Bacteroidetes bacterium]|nr:ROK family protein [Fibrella sp.]